MLYLGADHAGYPLKEQIKTFLTKKQVKFLDLGTNSTESVDASDYAVKVAKQVLTNKNNRGILVCGSGIMMSMAANRFKGVRAALAWHPEIIKQAREHNNVNVLVLSGREQVSPDWKKLVNIFLKTKALRQAKYLQRIKKLDNL